MLSYSKIYLNVLFFIIQYLNQVVFVYKDYPSTHQFSSINCLIMSIFILSPLIISQTKSEELIELNYYLKHTFVIINHLFILSLI